MCVTSAKKLLRRQVSDALKAMQAPAVSAQSAAVLAELTAIPAFTSSRCASVYLPMDGACEVDTWPILAAFTLAISWR